MTDALYDQFAPTVAVVYIGKKKECADKVAGTGVVWAGYGDVQRIHPTAAGMLLKYKDVFVREEDFKGKDKELKAKKAAAEKAAAEKAKDQEEAEKAARQESANVSPERVDAIIMAINSLDSTNKEHYFGNGKPKLKAINLAMPEDSDEVTNEELAFVLAELSD